MMHLLKADYEKFLLGLAGAAAGLCGIWFWQGQGDIRRVRAQPVAARLAGAPYEPAGLKPPESSVAVWTKALAQAHGPGWLYEAFTPPDIYYDSLTRTFAVTAPLAAEETGSSFGLELLAVKREQYRLQLRGYYGKPDSYIAVFTSPGQSGVILARAGHHLADLGLKLQHFSVKKVPVEHGDAWPVHDVAALAVLADEKTGGEVVLDSRTRLFTGRPLAVLQSAGSSGNSHELHEGDTHLEGNATYRVERISLDPPEVVVTRSASGLPQPETVILHPAAGSGKTADRPFRGRPGKGLAASHD